MIMKILLVEDDRAIRETCKVILESEGYSVSCAEDGLEGLNIGLTEKFDLIITDELMPNLNGTAMIKELLKHSIKTPVIICSAQKDVVCPSASAIISKPFDIEEVLEIIKQTVPHIRPTFVLETVLNCGQTQETEAR